jgi:hypothetical protein
MHLDHESHPASLMISLRNNHHPHFGNFFSTSEEAQLELKILPT